MLPIRSNSKEAAMPSIRIVKTPPSTFAPESIREQWLGVEIPLLSPEEAQAAEALFRQDDPNADGYIVDGTKAVEALWAAGKEDAAEFFGQPLPPQFLRFHKDCCEVVE